jgi:ubiquinone/menaquinone biosynthesis C-methylase UbiE
MESGEQLKELVKQKYGEIAEKEKSVNQSSCCGSGCCSSEVSNIMSDDYSELNGYNPDADLGLGCGLPTQFAKIKKGDVIVDLGSGAGNDCFIARAETGETGKVIGIDFTPAMISKARENSEKLGFRNVEFRQGDIESMPVSADSVDVVVSNCVLNLVPDKKAAFSEIYRVLKAGGHFSISDVVLEGELPSMLKTQAEMYVGCVAGALQKDDYLKIIEQSGFKELTIQKQKQIVLPEDILNHYLSKEVLETYRNQQAGIYSITVYGEKPKASDCCGSDCCQ